MFFIKFDAIPAGRKATYLRLVISDRPTKDNPRRVRFTIGGNKVDHKGDCRTKTADLSTAKILFNHVISTPDARFMTLDNKDFYLSTNMPHCEYMRIPVSSIPAKTMKLYNLEPLVHRGAVYVEIRKGMYDHPVSGCLANDKLVQILQNHEFVQSDLIPGLFKHKTRPLCFSLVVDDFGVSYVGKENASFLMKVLQDNGYTITHDWTGSIFCGITLNWDYANGTVDMSMPGYVEKALNRFSHIPPNKSEDSPHHTEPIIYGQKTQYTKEHDPTNPLDEKGIKRLQEIVCVLLYYARAIDCAMLPALGSLAAAQSKVTETTAKACTKLLNYAATHPDAVVRYHKSGMILQIHSDASCSSKMEARSRAGGFFYLGDNTDDSSPDAPPPTLNGAIHIL